MLHPPQVGSSEGPDTAAARLTDRKEKLWRGIKTQNQRVRSPPICGLETDEWLCHIFTVSVLSHLPT